MSAAEEALATDPTEERLSPNAVFDLLSSACRRSVLSCLADRPEGLTRDELLTYVTDRPHLDEVDVSQVEVTLYHVHLPKLADAGVVAYDETRATVERGPVYELLSAYLSAVTVEALSGR